MLKMSQHQSTVTVNAKTEPATMLQSVGHSFNQKLIMNIQNRRKFEYNFSLIFISDLVYSRALRFVEDADDEMFACHRLTL